jgi:hypothetical protein
MEVVAQSNGWRGLSITHTSCPFNTIPAQLQTPALTTRCERSTKAVPKWFVAHPGVHTIFLSANVDSHFDGDPVAGFRAAWRQLPDSVRRIYVIRDTPRIVRSQADCVNRLIKGRMTVGFRCAQPREANLRHDPAATAARSGADPRVKLLDFSNARKSNRRVEPTRFRVDLDGRDGPGRTRHVADKAPSRPMRATRYVRATTEAVLNLVGERQRGRTGRSRGDATDRPVHARQSTPSPFHRSIVSASSRSDDAPARASARPGRSRSRSGAAHPRNPSRRARCSTPGPRPHRGPSPALAKSRGSPPARNPSRRVRFAARTNPNGTWRSRCRSTVLRRGRLVAVAAGFPAIRADESRGLEDAVALRHLVRRSVLTSEPESELVASVPAS